MTEQLLNLLQSINNHFYSPFWKKYDFWLGVLNLFVLAITLWYLKKYTKETEQTKNQIARQTELEQMPIMLMFVRNIADSKNFSHIEKSWNKYFNFLVQIKTDEKMSNYLLRLRNTGKGTALNVEVKSDKFDIIDYETQFFAPQKDEHSIKIMQKGNKKIENWEMFKNSIFTIRCKDVVGNNYQFKYRIIDFKNRKIEYLGNKQN